MNIKKISLILISLIFIVPIVYGLYGITADVTFTDSSPGDGEWVDTASQTFGILTEEGIEPDQNVTFWTSRNLTKFSQNQTNSSVTNFSADFGNVFNFTQDYGDGLHYYYAESNNNTSTQSVTTSIRSMKVDTTAPVVYLQYPKSNNSEGTNTVFTATSDGVGYTNGRLTVYFNVTDTNINECQLLTNATNKSGELYNVQSKLGITSQANTTFGTISITGTNSVEGPAMIGIKCTDEVGNVGATDTNVSIIYDAQAPAISIISTSPGINNNQWETGASGNWSAVSNNVTDENPSECRLFVSNVTNSTQMELNSTISFTNQTVAEFPRTIIFANNYTGTQWHVICNDTLGHTTQSSTYTVFTDSVKPGTFELNYPHEGLVYVNSTIKYTTNGSDKTDINYNHTKIRLCKDSACAEVVGRLNFTGNNSKIDIPVNVSRTDAWYVNLTAVDHAGQETSSSNGTQMFFTDSKYMTLSAGWSILAFVRNETKDVEDVYDELVTTSISKQVCIFNISQNWQCFAGVADIVQHENISIYQPLAIWTNVSVDWGAPAYNNTTTYAAYEAENYTLINESATRWNLFCPAYEDGLSLRTLNDTAKINNSGSGTINGIMAGFSLFNNSATANESKYGSYIPDWEWFADDVIDFRAGVFIIRNETFFDQQKVSWAINRSRF